jgi:homoaconitase/3-isopropylmalate dehydratase large subunit
MIIFLQSAARLDSGLADLETELATVHMERFGRPGKTLLGSDSHTPAGGGIGMLAIERVV